MRADAGPDQTVYQGKAVVLDGSGSSAPTGGTIVSYQWVQLEGQTVALSNPAAPSPTFTAPASVSPPGENLQFQLTVTDNSASTASDNVTVTVLWGTRDDFSTDTRGSYATQAAYLDNVAPVPPPQFNYDPVGERLEILTENNVGLIFSRDLLAARDNGAFSLDYYPIRTHPAGGGIWIRLVQDAQNYYELAGFDWDDPSAPREDLRDYPRMTKVVDGVPLDVPFPSGTKTSYTSQDPPAAYHVEIAFTPAEITVRAFGEEFVVNTDPPAAVTVSHFEIQTNQQDAYYDNITYGAVLP